MMPCLGESVVGLAAIVCRAEESSAPEIEAALVYEFLGNIAEVGHLREEICRALGEQAVLVRLVLHSGSHSGDAVQVGQLSGLQSEVLRLEQINDASVVAFRRKMDSLITAALEEQTPILFV